MLRATLKSLLARKLRLVLSGLAVLLGVMFVSGSFVLTDALGRSFDNMFSSAMAETDVLVAADPGIDAWDNSQLNGFAVAVIGFSAVLSLLLSTVAALGVFNTVVLNVHERRRSLGMLKSIGMTPRQVVAMVLTSMALVGAVGGVLGIPLGMLAHRYILPRTADAARVAIPRVVLDVWHAPTLAALAVAGVLIALVGALVPARRAARLRIAEVLHNE